MSISRFLTFTAASTFISALALAQNPPAPEAPAAAAVAMEIPANSPCTQDVDTFCKGMMPGEGAIIGCLSEHSAHLSHACKGRLEQLRQTYLASASDCEGDIKSFCATTPQAGGKMIKCLKAHSKDLSAPCKALAAKMKETALAPMAAAPKAPAAAPAAPEKK